jgi:diguanylate cyclase (GGDEF)-like protein
MDAPLSAHTATGDVGGRERPRRGSIEALSGDALSERLEEEVNRAARHGTALSCLLLDLEDLPALALVHGEEFLERALAYVELALRRELRRFDRVGRPSEGELLVVLPGADGPHAEVVARRVLARLRSIKLEEAGRRRALHVAIGLAPRRDGMSAGALLGHARAAARLQRSENGRLPG